MSETSTPTNANAARASCAAAWMTLMLMLFGIGSVVFFTAGYLLGQEGRGDDGGRMIMLAIVFSAAAAGAGALVSRKRYGFYLLSAGALFAGVFQFLSTLRFDFALVAVGLIALTWWLIKPIWHKLD